MDNAKNLLRVAVIDDHPIFADGLTSLLKSIEQIGVVDVYHSGEDFLESIETKEYNVAFMDIRMKGMNGFETTKYTLAYDPEIKVVALTILDDSYSVNTMMEAGASAYITKSLTIKEVKFVIESIENGVTYITPDAAKNYTKKINTIMLKAEPTVKAESLFTDREIQIIKWMAQGKKAKEISAMFHLSVKSIEHEKKKIMEKMGVTKSTEIVVKAFQLKIIE